MDESGCATYIILFVVIFLIYCFYKFGYSRPKTRNLEGKHVVITGGSSGIGKAAAVEASKQGAHVTIIGRNVDKLEKAAIDVKQAAKNQSQQIQLLPLDITASFDKIENSLKEVECKVGPIYMLMNCAGQAICGTLENTSAKDMTYMMNLNYFGTAFATKAVLSGMKQRDEGIVVIVSTQAALLGLYGMTCYGAAKWAVRGFGEALMMETVGTGVTFTICYPPDTDTPGFEVEEASKPTETKLICQSGGLFAPATVAQKAIEDALAGRPYSVVGLEGWMMTMLTGSALQSLSHLLVQSILMGPLRIIMACYLISFHRIIIKCLNTKKHQVK